MAADQDQILLRRPEASPTVSCPGRQPFSTLAPEPDAYGAAGQHLPRAEPAVHAMPIAWQASASPVLKVAGVGISPYGLDRSERDGGVLRMSPVRHGSSHH